MNEIKERNYCFDNIKAIMIILMIFGHIIEDFGLNGTKWLIWSYIYSFHMPVFVFISGFFSKKISVDKTIKNIIIPYVIFDLLFVLFFYREYTFLNIFTPCYSFWYLLSLFNWRILIKSISKIKLLLLFSIILGLIIGIFNEFENFLSASRTVCFFPFFVFGYKFTELDYKKIAGKKFMFIFGLFVSAITIMLNIKKIIPDLMYTFMLPYSYFGISFKSGIILRGIIYLIAFSFIVVLIAIVPNKKTFLSIIGERTITIFLFSSFFIKSFFVLCPEPFLSSLNEFFQILISFMLTAIIVLLTGNKYVFKIYNKTIDFVSSIFLHKA